MKEYLIISILVMNLLALLGCVGDIEELYQEFNRGNTFKGLNTIGDLLLLIICSPSFFLLVFIFIIKKYILDIKTRKK